MARESRLRTAAWYGDRPLELVFPDDWQVTTHWPETPPPLSDEDIAAALEQPVGQPPLRELARGASRPLVIVDDLTRPTPAGRVIPPLLGQLADAGIPRERLTILLGSGSHGLIPADAASKKVGSEAASACRLLVHDCEKQAVAIGRTSFGTRVFVNPEVAASDLVIGVGGVYSQHSTGFGGGSKLAIGVLAKRSIVRLHYRHTSGEGSYEVDNEFRHDLDEVARLIGLRTTVSLHVDSWRQPVRIVCGDHERYYADAVAFSRDVYRAPPPGDADVVIANAYPMDVSLTFSRSKGVIPLTYAAPSASRVLIAACPEGVGLHGIFPFTNGPRFERSLHLARVIAHDPRAAVLKIAGRIRGSASRGVAAASNGAAQRRPILLFAPNHEPGILPESIPGMTALYDWANVLERIAAEQGGSRSLRTVVYPCAPLQVLEPSHKRRT